MGDVLGYARVSTDDQDVEGQRRRLKTAGAIRIFEDVISGKHFERPGLSQLLDYARPVIACASCASTGLVARCASCSKSSTC